ncbi:MAG: hypothetical protein IKO46_06240 [Salinivirgaceae bacterium]|nr:hypothetical protein [Salinivirgaceae bacterium]
MEKLSAYTIAANCTDIIDCNDGISELWDAYDLYKKAGRKVPEYIYKRIEKLETKRDKCSLKEHGMKYDEWLMSRFDKLEGASDGYIEAYKEALKKWLKYQNYKGDKRTTVYHILRDNAYSAREFLWQTPDGLPNIMKIGDWYFDEDITDYDTMAERIFGGLQGTKKAKQPTSEGKYIDDERHKFFMRLITKGRVKVEAAQELSLMLVNAMVEISQWKKRQYESPENTTDSLRFQNRMAAHDIVTRITGELLDKGIRVKSAEAVCDMIMDCLLAFADWKDQQHEAEKGLQGTKKADMKSANLRLHNAEPSVEALFGRKSSLLGSSNNTFSQIDIDEAKLEKNTQSAKNNLKKYQNGDYKPFDIPLKKLKLESLGRVLLWLRRLFKMIYHGQSSYNYYITPKGLLNFRISNHNANPKNFKANNADFNISVYVALFEHKYPDADVEYTEYRYSKEDYETYAEKIIDAIINGFGHALETGEFVDCSGYAKVIEHKKAVQPTDQSAPLPDTNAAAPFDIWFSGSKVVDADGNPLVVYHGTPEEPFNTFRRDYAKAEDGFWFTDDFRLAYEYALEDDEIAPTDGGVFKCYLNMRNPIVLDAHGKTYLDMEREIYRATQDADHDGVIVKNIVDVKFNNSPNRRPVTTYFVKHPNQIKSATRNNGHFSPDSDNIFEGVSGSDTLLNERRLRLAKAKAKALKLKLELMNI